MKSRIDPPARVLMTADTIGGVWTYALELARVLGACGVKVGLATMGELPDSTQREEVRRVPAIELFESSFRLEWMEQPWDDVAKAGEWLLQLEDRIRPDVIHLNGYAHGSLPWRAPVVMVGHSCVLSWWRAVKGERASDSWSRYRHAVANGLRAADLVVAPSQSMLSALEEHYGMLPAYRVIHNGRRVTVTATALKKPFILSAGRLWDEAKNVVMLERVAPRLPWSVYVAGDGTHPWCRVTSAGGLQWLGRLGHRELAEWMAHAAIYALPARYEPFGLSALEAAQAGCALVLGDIPSLREVWGDAAVFVPPDDAEALAAALEALIREEKRRRFLASLARERARIYTPERMGEEYLTAYTELLARRTEKTGGKLVCAS